MRQRHHDPTTTTAPAVTSGIDAERLLRTAAAAGDPDAFAVLYRQCRDIVYRYLLRRTSGDPHLAEDLTHETFARALARIGTYQEMGRPFVAWLLTIAGNLVADYYKSGWRRLQVPHGDPAVDMESDGNDLMWAEPKDDLASTVVAGEYQRYVRAVLVRAMDDLTVWQQQVMRLRYIEGLSVRDTALKLETHEGAVKAAAYRAVRVLARNPQLRKLSFDLLH